MNTMARFTVSLALITLLGCSAGVAPDAEDNLAAGTWRSSDSSARMEVAADGSAVVQNSDCAVAFGFHSSQLAPDSDEAVSMIGAVSEAQSPTTGGTTPGTLGRAPGAADDDTPVTTAAEYYVDVEVVDSDSVLVTLEVVDEGGTVICSSTNEFTSPTFGSTTGSGESNADGGQSGSTDTTLAETVVPVSPIGSADTTAGPDDGMTTGGTIGGTTGGTFGGSPGGR